MKAKILLPVILLLAAAIAVSGCVTNTGDNSENDPIIGTFIFSEPFYADFLPEHTEGVIATPTCIFYPGGLGLETWRGENGEILPPIIFLWENLGKNQYHISMMEGDGTIYTENAELSEDGTELVPLVSGETGKYKRSSNLPVTDPVIGTFTYSAVINADYLKDYPEGIMARPSYIFYENGLGLQKWKAENGEDLSPRQFVWKNKGNNLYQVLVQNGNGTTFTEELTLSQNGDELVSTYLDVNGQYVRVNPTTPDDPVIGIFTYSEFTIPAFLSTSGEATYAQPTDIFFSDGTGIQSWAGENGELLKMLVFSWENKGNNVYHLDVHNSNTDLYRSNLTLSEDGMQLISANPNTKGYYLRTY
ncbi:MAG: hypothetical protein Q4Q20_00035 [Methanocorpusculum sp.]|nr:hypothetical protein [Methanocorpusculum sp.]